MSDLSDDQARRRAFADELDSHIIDLKLLGTWVAGHPDFPVPHRDDFAASQWSVFAWDDGHLERLAGVLGDDGTPVERPERIGYRTARRRFGSVVLEVWRAVANDVGKAES